MYAVNDLFMTLQGEGAQTGRPAVFCRFAGCNLWSGREQDRESAVCQFCDTDFVGTDGDRGARFETASRLAEAVESTWRAAADDQTPASNAAHRYVVCTGGEPLLQLDTAAIDALHAADFDVAVETNGTQPVPDTVDWVCVSPKAGADLVQTTGDELKLVFPQQQLMPDAVADLNFDYFFLQPMDGPRRDAYTQRAIEYCQRHPQWRLSIQTHKYIGID